VSYSEIYLGCSEHANSSHKFVGNTFFLLVWKIRRFESFFRHYFKIVPTNQITKYSLEKINQDLVKAFNKFAIEVEMAPQMGGNPAEKWIEVFEAVTVEIKVALEEIEHEFRVLLGER
jgi:hypothetical protein